MIKLESIGWNPDLEKEFEPHRQAGLEPGRVAVENRHLYLIYTRHGDLSGEVTGKLLYNAESPADLPKVGDWVAVSVFEDEEKAIIHRVLPRRTKFSRRVAGKKTEEQLIAANIDTIFIVQGLDDNFN